MAIDELHAYWSTSETYDYRFDELVDLQLAAADERLRSSRETIRVLDRRADDASVERIERREDLIPLLFSHTTYKSYPQAFVRQQRWDRLAAWLGTLSTATVGSIDFDGVADIDGWLERMQASGHHVTTSSGTTGRTSFLNMNDADLEWMKVAFDVGVREVTGHTNSDRAAFLGIAPGNSFMAQLVLANAAAAAARPDDIHYMADEPLRAADLAAMGELRAAIADGTATPAEIVEAEKTARAREERVTAQLDQLLEQILARREEPIMVAGTQGFLWRVVDTARQRGIPDGAFHPDSIMFRGGGLKGVQAPPDFIEQMRIFFTDRIRQWEGYGMSELIGPMPRCDNGRYHASATTLILVLDKSGTQLAGEHRGVVEGRFAALDLLLSGRWGGVITGDKVTVDFEPCACGRRSPGVVDVVRYSDLPEGDDKLSCSGTVEAYVRGEISAAPAPR